MPSIEENPFEFLDELHRSLKKSPLNSKDLAVKKILFAKFCHLVRVQAHDKCREKQTHHNSEQRALHSKLCCHPENHHLNILLQLFHIQYL